MTMAAAYGKRLRAPAWTEEATIDLLNMIQRENVVAEVMDKTRQRNAHIFGRIAQLMNKAGHCSRTPDQIRQRWKNLKRMYIREKRSTKFPDGQQSLNPNYSSIMDKLMQDSRKFKALKANYNKPLSRARVKPGAAAVANMSDDELDEDDNQVQDDLDGATEIEKIMNAEVVCILDEASGTESAELHGLPVTSTAAEEPASRRPAVQAGIRPRTLKQYKRKDNVADKLLAVMQKQTRLMEEEQAWRRGYVAEQQQWEERMLNAQMNHLQTMMVNVTKMIMPMMTRNNPVASTTAASASPLVTVAAADAMADLWATTESEQLM